MAYRIAFTTTWPERMGAKAGQRNYFPEKILKGTYNGTNYFMAECPDCGWIGCSVHAHGGGQIADTGDYFDISCPECGGYLEDSDYDYGYYGNTDYTPKTTTIRKNYKYWKSKEGKMIQPFIWSGNPRSSKQVPFCPEVRLKRVSKIRIEHKGCYHGSRGRFIVINKDDGYEEDGYCHIMQDGRAEKFVQSEGFDTVDDFFLWFNEDFNGALLEWS